MLDFLASGVLDLPWWGYIIFGLVVTQITIAAVTLYLHRCQAHRGVDLHPVLSHFFRFWIWLTTSMRTVEWVAVHRKHHAHCEKDGDPHSPHVDGFNKVMWEGAELYRTAVKDTQTLEKHGHGAPQDWIENNLYTPYLSYGIVLMAVIDLLLLGLPGITVWAIQMAWIPFFAAGVINGLGHWWGYRNFETADGSTNLTPWAVIIGGEELHNNHHAYPSSAKFSIRRWEFDLGWMYLRTLAWFKLAKVKRIAPKPMIDPAKAAIDLDTVKAVIATRMHVFENYAKMVVMPVLKDEMHKADAAAQDFLKRARKILVREESRMDEQSKRRLGDLLASNNVLNTVYEYRCRLQELWDGRALSHEKLIAALQEWCAQAEATGIKALQEFAARIRSYSLQPMTI